MILNGPFREKKHATKKKVNSFTNSTTVGAIRQQSASQSLLYQHDLVSLYSIYCEGDE